MFARLETDRIQEEIQLNAELEEELLELREEFQEPYARIPHELQFTDGNVRLY